MCFPKADPKRKTWEQMIYRVHLESKVRPWVVRRRDEPFLSQVPVMRRVLIARWSSVLLKTT